MRRISIILTVLTLGLFLLFFSGTASGLPWLMLLLDSSEQISGKIDTSFSGDGIASLDINNHDDISKDVAIQTNEKIIVAGTCDTNTENPCFAIARFNENGSIDTSFANNGIAQTAISGTDTDVRALALQADGKIVVAGISGDYGNTAITLVRYTADGELDTTFDSDGIVQTVVVVSTHNWGDDLVIQPDGKIIVAGTVWNSTYDFVLLRYNTDGSLDTNFGTNGIKIFDLGNWDFGYAMALQKDGKIIVAGRSGTTSSGYDFALVRCNSDGTTDETFGQHGIVISHVTDSYGSISSLVVQPDDKIVAVGTINASVALARYLKTGILDTSFNGDGVIGTTVKMEPHDVTLQDDGKILVSGHNDENATDLVVARFTLTGSLDPGFGDNGLFILNLADEYGMMGFGIALQSDGRIITTGRINNGTEIEPDFDFLLVRLR